jgi:hypothetical protein
MRRLEAALGILAVLMVGTYLFANFDLINSSITGYNIMSTRLVIVAEDPTDCNMTFESGWNFVSFPCISSDISIGMLLPNLSYSSIRHYTPLDTDPWKSYNPSLPAWAVQDLSMLSRRSGYWIHLSDETDYYINNTLGTPTLISLVPGWNMIGYPSRTIRLVNDTFSQVEPNFEYVYLYNASDTADPWKQYTWNTSLPSDQDLTHTVLYYGYWIYMTEPDTLVIN